MANLSILKFRCLRNFIPKGLRKLIKPFFQRLLTKPDKEMFYVDGLLKSKRRFLDVGANQGTYSIYFLDKFEKIDAFEPLSEVPIKKSVLKDQKLSIHHVALSDHVGEMDFYIPIRNGEPVTALASLEERDPPYAVRRVPIKRIDDYDFQDVDLIKIDVEGHEYKTIKGAKATIDRCSPTLIVEIEQRHLKISINDVFNAITNLGYNGFFLKDGCLTSIDEFNYEVHQLEHLNQRHSNRYVNNFIFTKKVF